MMSFIDSLFLKENRASNYKYKCYQSRDEYYVNLLRDDTLSRLLDLFERQHNSYLNRELQISFQGLPFGIGKNYIFKKMGKARYEYDNNNRVPSHKILFYRTAFKQFKTITQLHLIKDRFFYAKYSFRHVASDDTNNILTVLRNKYFYTDQFEDKLSQVKDAQQNTILLEKSLNLNIGYLSGDPFFYNFIASIDQIKKDAEEELRGRHLKTLQHYL